MSREMMLGMLRQGNTGDEILSILDIIGNGSADDDSAQSVFAEPTLSAIEFW